MSEEVLQQHSDLIVVNANHISLRMGLKLGELSIHEQRKTFGGDRETGHFYLFTHDEFPDIVYECIVSSVGGDAVTSLYHKNRIFNSPGELMTARNRLIAAIADKVGISRRNVSVDDEGRGRSLFLEELSTGQLVDMLANRMGKSIVVSNSHSAAGMGGIAA